MTSPGSAQETGRDGQVLRQPQPPEPSDLPSPFAYPVGTVIEVGGRVYKLAVYDTWCGGSLEWGRVLLRAPWYRWRARS